MYIEKGQKKEQTHGQNITTLEEKQQETPYRRKIQENKGIMSWLNQELNINKQNQRTLQQKIIQLYQQIEKKTIKNLQKKNNNQILQAQIQIYLNIINKIQRKKIYNQQNKQENTYNYTFHQQNIDPYTFQQRNILTKQQNCQEKQLNNQFKMKINNQFQINCQGYLLKNNKQDINDNKQEQLHSYYQKETDSNEKQRDESKFKVSLKTELTQFNYSKNRKKSSQFKENKENKDNISTTSRNFDSLISISHINAQNFLTQLKTNRQSNSNFRSPTLTHRTQNEQCQRQTIYVSPRPSIGMATPKLCSPNKSFLKKNNMSTGNLLNIYSSIDIQDLWRESKPLINNRVEKNIIPRSNAKDYINSLRGNNLKLKSKFS